MMQNTVRPMWLGLALTVVLTVAACSDYAVRLPGGYSLVSVFVGAVLITRPTDHVVVVDANIDRYEVLDGLVVGHVSAEGLPETHRSYSKPGYFIVNTTSHEVTQGLDRATWLDSLQAMGITNEPRLSKPSPFDRFFHW